MRWVEGPGPSHHQMGPSVLSVLKGASCLSDLLLLDVQWRRGGRGVWWEVWGHDTEWGWDVRRVEPTPEEQGVWQSKGRGSRPLRQALGIIDYSWHPFAYQNFKQPASPANKVISKIKLLSSPSSCCLLPFPLNWAEDSGQGSSRPMSSSPALGVPSPLRAVTLPHRGRGGSPALPLSICPLSCGREGPPSAQMPPSLPLPWDQAPPT